MTAGRGQAASGAVDTGLAGLAPPVLAEKIGLLTKKSSLEAQEHEFLILLWDLKSFNEKKDKCMLFAEILRILSMCRVRYIV